LAFYIYKNTKIHYTDQGKGSAVVLLHGFLENSTMWNSLAQKLSKKNRVVAIDLLGHGNTENHAYIHTMETQADMVMAVLKKLRLRKYTMVGHSMGGYIALAFAKLFPSSLKGLCLMNSTAYADTKEKKINRDRAIKAVKQNHKLFVRIAIPMLFSEENRAVYKTKIKVITTEALQTSTQGIVAALEGMKIRKNSVSVYKNVTFPILMIIGKKDPALDYHSLIEQTKNTIVQVVEFSDGHMSHIENEHAFSEALTIFIRSCI